MKPYSLNSIGKHNVVYTDIEPRKIYWYWQFLAYMVVTIAEIFLSVTTLELLYTESPIHLKAICQSMYQLSVVIGSAIVMLITYFFSSYSRKQQFYIYGFMSFGAALSFVVQAKNYTYADQKDLEDLNKIVERRKREKEIGLIEAEDLLKQA